MKIKHKKFLKKTGFVLFFVDKTIIHYSFSYFSKILTKLELRIELLELLLKCKIIY